MKHPVGRDAGGMQKLVEEVGGVGVGVPACGGGEARVEAYEEDVEVGRYAIR